MAAVEQSYVSLDTRTSWTPGAISSPAQYVQVAESLGMTALGIADRDTIRGWQELDREALGAGIKPVFSLEKNLGFNRVTLVAVNGDGIRSLTGLSDAEVVTPDDLTRNQNGLIVVAPLSSCSRLVDAVSSDRLYVEIGIPGVSTNNKGYLSELGMAGYFGLSALASTRPWIAEDIPFAQMASIIRYARELKSTLPSRLTDARWFSLFADNGAAYLKISKLAKVPDFRVYLASFKPEGRLWSHEELARMYPPEFEGLLTESGRVAGMSEITRLPKPSLPRYPVPEGQTSHGLLRERCLAGFAARLKRATPQYWHRFEYELDIISRVGLTDHFLIAQDLVTMMRQEKIALVGIGSATASLVAYLLGITDIDPVSNDLPFERFLTLATKKVTDIDWVVDPLRIDRVMERIYSEFPDWNCYPYMITTHPTYGMAGALREVMGTFGYGREEISGLIDNLRHKRKVDNAYLPYVQVAAFFEAMHMVHGNVNVYPSKIVLTGEPVLSGYGTFIHDRGPVADITKETAEMWSNFDFVHNYGLSLITNTCEAVGLDPDMIPVDDAETLRTIFRGDTDDVPFLWTGWLKKVLRKVATAVGDTPSMEDLVHAFGLSRPAGEPSMESYIRRRRGLSKIPDIHPVIGRVLSETYGTLIFQEQVTRLATELAGFTPEEAEFLRRTISKERDPARIETLRQRFVDGAYGNGLKKEIGEQLFTRISDFASYGFLKGHTWEIMEKIAYRSAFLKRHYATEYRKAIEEIGDFMFTGENDRNGGWFPDA